MAAINSITLAPGTRVRVSQRMFAGDQTFTRNVVGTVVDHGHETTGSWFAHAKGGRLPLERLRLRKDDGEITNLVLDRYATVAVLVDR